jgi:hypothetical protein
MTQFLIVIHSCSLRNTTTITLVFIYKKSNYYLEDRSANVKIYNLHKKVKYEVFTGATGNNGIRVTPYLSAMLTTSKK